jgi:hypothetical protein
MLRNWERDFAMGKLIKRAPHVELARNALTLAAATLVLVFHVSGLQAQQRVEPFPDSRSGGSTTRAPAKGPVATPLSCEQYETINTEIAYECLPPPPSPKQDTWTLIKTVTTTDATLNLATQKCDVVTMINTYKIASGKCDGKTSLKPKDSEEKNKWVILFEKLTGETAKKGN